MAAQAPEFGLSDFDRLSFLMLTIGKEEEFKAEIEKEPSLVTIENEEHMTLLHIAARHGKEKICEILIENDADPSFPGGRQRNLTALYYALEHNCNFARSLIEVIKKVRNEDLTPLLIQILERKIKSQSAIAVTRSSMLDCSSPIFSRSSEETDSDDELLAADKAFCPASNFGRK